MKKFIGKSAAIAAAALLFAQSVPMMNIEATDADKSKLTIHPYILNATDYAAAKDDKTYDEKGTTADAEHVATYSSASHADTMQFKITRVNENGTDYSGAGEAYEYTTTDQTADNIPDGFYRIDPVDNSTNQDFSESDAFYIQLPVAASGGNNRDVHIYPKLTKNDEQDSKHYVTLTKKDNSATPAAVAGAKYKVYYQDSLGNWKYALNQDGTAKEYETDSSGQITISKLPLGDYWFVETFSPATHLLNQEPIKFTIDGKTAAANISAQNDKLLTVKKESAEDAGGDSFNWKITADIPSRSQNLLTYNIYDVYGDSNGSDFQSISVTSVTIDGAKLDNSKYSVNNDSTNKILTVSLKKDAKSDLSGHKSIVVNVTSKLASNNVGEVKNEAKIDYQYAYDPDSNTDSIAKKIPDIPNPDIDNPSPSYNENNTSNPAVVSYPSGSSKNPADSVSKLTFTVSNVGTEDNNTELMESEYTIRKAGYLSGDYSVTEQADDAITGKLVVSNLAPGRYEIIQTKVKTGYLISETSVFIHVGKDGKLYSDGINGNRGNEIQDKIVKFTNVKSNDNFALPFTGTTATRVFTIGGICVMLAAGTLIFVVLRKKDDDGEETKG